VAPADDALVNAIRHALTQAGIPESGYSTARGRPQGTGFDAWKIMSPQPRAGVDWYEDGHEAGGPWDTPSAPLLLLERALHTAGFQTEQGIDAGTLYLIVWRHGPF
jgi:hypothetical protein